MAKPMTKTEWMNWLEKAWDEAQRRKWVGLTGMTLRDYFAAKAMQGFIDYAAATGRFAPPDDQLAQCSYDVADAMLRARER